MENEIFKRKTIQFEKLEKFGFLRIKDGYFIEKKIYSDMIARVIISEKGEVSGEIFDEDLREPYVNYRIEGVEGAFVVGVRNAYLAFLQQIADAVTTEKRYLFDQSNRLNDYIEIRFCVRPEYLWKKFPHYGVYRNPSSRKWFAILMNIGKGKVIPGAKGETEVINLKTDDLTEHYVALGAYPAYHLNHKNWVTVILDGTLSDELIQEMLLYSFANAAKNGVSKKKLPKREF